MTDLVVAPPKRPRVPAWLSLALRLALVAALFAWIFRRVDFAEFAHTLQRANPLWLALAALAILASQLTAGWRWHRLLKAAGARWTFGQSFAVYGAGLFLGLFIPTGVGGDVYRVARVRGSGAGLARGAATILLERAIGLLALLLLGTGFVYAHPGTRPWAVPLAIGSLAGLGGLATLWIPGGPEAAARVLDRFPGRGLGDRMRAAFPADAMGRLHGAIPGTVLLSLLNHAWLLTVNVLLAIGLALPATWTSVCAAVPLVLLAAQIPITPGGAGVREAAYVYFFARIGVGEAPALALALGWFALLVFVSLLGSIGFLFERSAAEPGPV
ncbi:MAG: lysylphosphatidylglycerol synthase transmembrane domain-containing protein [Candidatus Eisenbacteria bacterium]